MLRKVSGTNAITCYGGNSVHASQECSIDSTEITKNNIMSKMYQSVSHNNDKLNINYLPENNRSIAIYH